MAPFTFAVQDLPQADTTRLHRHGLQRRQPDASPHKKISSDPVAHFDIRLPGWLGFGALREKCDSRRRARKRNGVHQSGGQGETWGGPAAGHRRLVYLAKRLRTSRRRKPSPECRLARCLRIFGNEACHVPGRTRRPRQRGPPLRGPDPSSLSAQDGRAGLPQRTASNSARPAHPGLPRRHPAPTSPPCRST